MYLYTNEFYGNYEAGIIIVAARNAFRAMEIIREQMEMSIQMKISNK